MPFLLQGVEAILEPGKPARQTLLDVGRTPCSLGDRAIECVQPPPDRLKRVALTTLLIDSRFGSLVQPRPEPDPAFPAFEGFLQGPCLLLRGKRPARQCGHHDGWRAVAGYNGHGIVIGRAGPATAGRQYTLVMKLHEVLERLQALAPEHLAEPWDKVGLHVGDAGQSIRRGLLCIDLTDAVLIEAARQQCDLIVAYHPPIFEPIATLTEATWKGRVLRQAIRRSIAIYSPHTALDAAEGGVNDWLLDGIVGRTPCQRRPIRPTPHRSGAIKLVTFVPPDHADRLRSALSAAGAGVIGQYTHCSFGVVGEGTFLGSAGTRPAVGRAGRFERVTELRMEMVASEQVIPAVVAALRAVHPYEEPAFDLFPLAPAEPARTGAGRVATLDKPITLRAIVERIKRGLGLDSVDLARPAKAGAIRRVAVCAGAGGSLLEEAGPVDLFVTGEMRHHDVLDAVQSGVSVVLCGHTQTERPYLPTYRQRLSRATGPAVTWRLSRADAAPTVRA